MTLNTIYIYIIPPITIFSGLLNIYLFSKILKSDETLDEHLKQVREKEVEEFDNFIRAIQEQKKETEEKCVSDKLHLEKELQQFYEEIRNNLNKTIIELNKKDELSQKRIKNLENENIKYKKTCKSKFAQVERLKEEIATLKQKLNEVTTNKG